MTHLADTMRASLYSEDCPISDQGPLLNEHTRLHAAEGGAGGGKSLYGLFTLN